MNDVLLSQKQPSERPNGFYTHLEAPLCVCTLPTETGIASTLVNVHAHLAIAGQLVARVADTLEAALSVDALPVVTDVTLGG